MTKSKADLIYDTVNDLVADFLYYDRQEDEELPYGEIQKAIVAEDVSVEQIVNWFEAKLCEGLQG